MRSTSTRETLFAVQLVTHNEPWPNATPDGAVEGLVSYVATTWAPSVSTMESQNGIPRPRSTHTASACAPAGAAVKKFPPTSTAAFVAPVRPSMRRISGHLEGGPSVVVHQHPPSLRSPSTT